MVLFSELLPHSPMVENLRCLTNKSFSEELFIRSYPRHCCSKVFMIAILFKCLTPSLMVKHLQCAPTAEMQRILPLHTPTEEYVGMSQYSLLEGSHRFFRLQMSPDCRAHIIQQPHPSLTRLTPQLQSNNRSGQLHGRRHSSSRWINKQEKFFSLLFISYGIKSISLFDLLNILIF